MPSHLTFLALLLATLCLLATLNVAQASPLAVSLAKRGPIITYDDAGRITNVTDPTTGVPITQGDATDGGGSGLDIAAIIWLAWSFAVGVPMMLAGIRLWRFTTGVGIGLSMTVCIWSAFANALSASGISDLVLTLIVLGAFVASFIIGLFDSVRFAGILFLSALGGLSIGVRVVLFRPDLLVPSFAVNWIIVGVFGAITLALFFLNQRVAILISSASVGTFFTFLGVDLLVSKQSGLSFGLRYLFDRNDAHLQYLFSRGWHPGIMDEILLGVSIALIPIFAYAQHHVFKTSFKRNHLRTFSLSSRTSVDSTIEDEKDVSEADRSIAATPMLTSEKPPSVSEPLLQEVPFSPTTPASVTSTLSVPSFSDSRRESKGTVGYAV